MTNAKPPRLFVRDQDLERLLSLSKDPTQLAEARADRAAAWAAYDGSEEGTEPEKAALARLECRDAQLHRFGPPGCQACHTRQERRPGSLSMIPPMDPAKPASPDAPHPI